MVESVQTDHHDKQESDAHEGFKEQRRQKWSSSDNQVKRKKKAAMHTTGAKDPQISSQLEQSTHNFLGLSGL
jgi:hypothetical protein